MCIRDSQLSLQMQKGSKADGTLGYMTEEQYEQLVNSDFVEQMCIRDRSAGDCAPDWIRPYGTALLHWFALRFSFYRRSALCNDCLLYTSKYAIIDGVLDEDLYQELSIILLKAIKLFKI